MQKKHRDTEYISQSYYLNIPSFTESSNLFVWYPACFPGVICSCMTFFAASAAVLAAQRRALKGLQIP
jgi:hypothetical protein